MIPIWVFIILGSVQGILEWLPVSSEGQIIFLGNIFGVSDPDLVLSIAFWLHFGTMISVLILFREEWFTILNIFDPIGNFWRKFLVITTIGTAIVGIPVKIILLDLVNGESVGLILMIILALALLITAFLLKFQSSFLSGSRTIEEMTYFQMLLVGFAQGITIIPGVSRSGTTVTVLLFQNIKNDDAFRGSFFMSVPAVLGAVTLDLLDYFTGETSSIVAVSPFGVFIGIVFAAIFGIVTMKLLIDLAKDIDFSSIVLGLALLIIIYILILI